MVKENKKIDKNMLLSELLTKYPKAARLLLKTGIHCIGCHMSAYETIEQGCKVHGMEEKEIDVLIKRMNEVINKKIDIIDITEEAASYLKELMKKESKENYYVFLSVTKEDDNLSYNLELKKDKNESDKEITIKGIKFLIDNNSFDLIKGKEIDIDNYGFIIE